MKNNKNNIFIIPQFSIKIGYGHLKRSLILYDLLKRDYNVKIIFLKEKADTKVNSIPGDTSQGSASGDTSQGSASGDTSQGSAHFQNKDSLIKYILEEKPLFVIMDFMYYPAKLVKKISHICRLILFDSIKRFSSEKSIIYFNSTTPIKYKYLNKNCFIYEGLDYLPLNKDLVKYLTKKETDNKGLFICFGNSDPHRLSLKVLKVLKHIKLPGKLCLNIGKYCNREYKQEIKKYLKEHFTDYRTVENKESIIPELFRNNFLITSFSITALEGLLLLKKVGLYNNSTYHTRLSKFINGFYYLGTRPFSKKFQIKPKLKKFLSSPPCNLFGEYKNNNKNIIKIISRAEKTAFSKDRTDTCPACNKKNIKLILNHTDKQIYHCMACKSKFLIISRDKNILKIYKNTYFNEEYKEQYGKTYLEDKDNILKLAQARLEIISSLLEGKTEGKKILDIGSAYGFFLDRARSFNFNPSGIEIEKKACAYAKNKLKIKMINNSFLKADLNKKFDIITLWYVLEHFPDPEAVLNKILSILNPGGLLCLSLPNGNSPFYHFNRKEWLKLHPDDHFIDYSVKGIRSFLKRKGFCLVKKNITGFHPERYKKCPCILRPFLKLFKQGDTMELYFKKALKRLF